MCRRVMHTVFVWYRMRQIFFTSVPNITNRAMRLACCGMIPPSVFNGPSAIHCYLQKMRHCPRWLHWPRNGKQKNGRTTRMVEQIMLARILVAGGDGQLGREFADITVPGVELLRCSRSELDITNLDNIHSVLAKYQPQAVINAAAYTAVDRAETEAEQAFAINANGAGHL